jgi:Protein of unknown function (DUF3551)
MQPVIFRTSGVALHRKSWLARQAASTRSYRTPPISWHRGTSSAPFTITGCRRVVPRYGCPIMPTGMQPMSTCVRSSMRVKSAGLPVGSQMAGRKSGMRILIFVLGGFVATICGETSAEAQNYPWCAYYNYGQGGGGATNCGFTTFQQCLAAVSGVGGNCGPNPMFQPTAGPYSSRRHPRRYPY